MVVRSSCIIPVSTVPHGGQIIVYSTSQHSTTWWSDHRVFHQSALYHMVVRSSCIPPVNTVPHGGQIIVYSTSQHSTTWWSDHPVFHRQHSTTWWSDHRVFHQSTLYHMLVRSLCIPAQYHTVVRSSCIPPVNTVPHGGQIIVYSLSLIHI